MTLSRSITKKIRRGLTIRSSSLFESPKPAPKPFRPTISLPLERPDVPSIIETESADRTSLDSTSKSPSTSSTHNSFVSSTSSSRASSSSRTSYDSCFPPSQKKVSFVDAGVRRYSATSSVYASEGKLPPPIEDDEDIQLRIGKNRFSAAEYIKEIEGTPMILVDGKLYL